MPNPRKHFTVESAKNAQHKSKRKWDEKNKEKLKAYKQKWYHQNKHKYKELWNLRDRRKRLAEGEFSPSDIARIYELQNKKCAICAVKLNGSYHRDHIIPLSGGGSNWPSNIQLLCPRCNLSKGARDPIDHMRTLGRLL